MILQDISVSRHGKPLFKPFSVECVTTNLQIIAGNGVGKSTLLEALAGLRIYQGQFDYKNKPSVHYIGHRNGTYLALTVQENLRIAAYLAGCQNVSRACQQAVEDWQIHSLLDQSIKTLSAGQQRRIALARLSLSARSLWLLDEPQAHLDALGIELLFKHCAQHCQRGGQVIITAHQDLRTQYDLPWLAQEVCL